MSRLSDQLRLAAASLVVLSVLQAGTLYTASPGTQVVPNQLLVRFQTGTSIQSVNSVLLPGSSAAPIVGLQDVYLVRLPSGTDPAFAAQLSQQAVVQYVEPNRIRSINIATPNDTLFSDAGMYGLTKVQAMQAWQLLPNAYLTSAIAGAAATRIKVAVIDTGADCTHPDFINAGGSSTDAASGGQFSFTLSQAFVATTVASPACPWADDNEHGTHTAGTVAAATNNGVGVASLGYPLELIIYKVLDHSGSGSDADVSNAIITAANAGANVISMSLGSPDYSPTIQSALNVAWQHNCVVVAASGNGNSSAPFFPAEGNFALSVAATDSGDNRATFSNFGMSVDIAAPGVSILSTLPPPNPQYGYLTGTSMATPHVAALAGLINVASPNLAALAVMERIQQSADSTYPNGGWDGSTSSLTSGLGYGRINAWRAISIGNLRSASVGGIVGQVVDGSGNPVNNVLVSVPGQSTTTLSASNGVSTVATGLFRLSNLAPGTYTITLTATGFPTTTVKTAVVAGADADLTIVMATGQSEFHGVVTDGGNPVSGGVVQALASGLVQGAAFTDSTGSYSITLAPGTYDLRASTMYGVTTTNASHVVGAGGSVAVNIAMALMGTIVGQVTDISNAPIPNAQISVSASGFTAGAITDVTGHYSTVGIPAGTYSVSASAGGVTATISGAVVTNDHATTENFGLSLVSTTVTTNPANLATSVDSVGYTAPHTFLWTPSSSHTIAILTSPQAGTPGTQYAWANWSDAGAISHSVTPAVDTTYTANFKTQYQLTTAASPSAGGSVSPASGSFFDAGTVVALSATPNSGYVFASWTGPVTSNSVTMSAPETVTANFAVNTVVTTSPPGLSITIDGVNTFTAPHTFVWNPGDSHTIAVTTPQAGGAGTQSVFTSWSDAGAVSHPITVGTTPATYTASFKTQFQLTISASPAAGGTVSPASGGFYDSGTVVPVSATANSGYVFANWTGPVTSNSVTMSAPETATANFTALTAVTIQSAPAGLSASVDGGTAQATPFTANLTPGPHTIAVLTTQAGTTGTQYVFTSWSDAGAASHPITVTGSPASYTANFKTQYQLTISASPVAGGTVSPASGSFYDSGTVVPVSATANSGYVFANWTGPVTSNSVTMSAPQTVTANFTALTAVTIQSAPAGLSASVDGATAQATPFTANLTPGSHTIAVLTTQAGTTGTQYVFTSWSDAGAASHPITVTGSPATYTANFKTQFQLTISASPAAGGTVSPASGGFYDSGTVVPVSATANSGYVFGSWTGPVVSNSVTMSAPETVTANFTALTAVTIQSAPAGLSASVDGGTAQGTPFTANLTPGSHTIAVSATQPGTTGTQYVFTSWSDAGAASRPITVTGSPATYTANFKTQFQLTTAASPVAGGTVSPASGGFYDSGTVVPLSTTANSGYVFGSWTGPVTTNSVTMSAPESVTANFTALTAVSIQSSPSGRLASVDGGAAQATPFTANLTPGSHNIAVLATQAGTAGTQYVFTSWSDAGAASHPITVTGSPATYTANFKTQYQLTTAASPAAGGTVTPASGGFYDSGTGVPVSATANSGYVFGSWTGPVSSNSVTMSAPQTVTANFTALTAITIQTSVAGLLASVDGGAAQATPFTVNLTPGSHPIAVSTLQPGTAGTQYVFTAWSDAGAPSHTIAVTASPATFTANFKTQYQLTISASPAAGGSETPASGGFYDSGTVVPVSEAPNSGYFFANWAGPVTNNSVTMSAPETVTANFASLTGVTIQSSPAGLLASIDNGAPQATPFNANLTPGTHTVAVATTQAGPTGTQYVFTNWSDAGAPSHSITVTASPAIYTANFKTQFQLTASASPIAGGSVTPGSGGFYDSGTVVPVSAAANAGYVFGSWTGPVTNSSVTMNLPTTITANFTALAGVTIQSSPAGRLASVDGAAAQPTPFSVNLTPGAHTIAVLTTQAGTAGTQYVFTNWSDGGAVSHSITVTGSPATYTANFKTQYLLTISASPAAGGSVTPATGSFYDSGTVVPVSATANSGYVFANWNGPVTNNSVTMTAPQTVTASFSSMAGVTIATNPPGLSIIVDGATSVAPQNFNWVAGSNHTIAVSTSQTAPGTRYSWTSWSDSGTASHSVTAPAAAATFTANFSTQYLLSLTASPVSGGALAANPPSGDGYYAGGTSVQITAAANAGYQFANFSGDLSNSVNPQTLVLSAPRSVTGTFTAVSTISVLVDHTQLFYGYSNGVVTSPQTVRVTVPPGTGWTASSNQNNITVAPSSGTGNGTFQVIVSPGSSGIVTVTPQVPNGNPQQVQVTVSSVTPGSPFGSFDTPSDQATGIAGAIAVTGWALDKIQVTKVDIWREPVGIEPTQSNGLVYIGDAVFVAGARPDVEAAFPTTPWNYRAGWGYLLLTNFLPNSGGAAGPGNGSYKLHAIAHNKTGSSIDLGTHTITVDNAHANKPFGTIDTPTQGGNASGNAFVNFGWALTQNPYVIPLDGSTISVTVDGVTLGHPTYNQFRSDIATAFPGLANSQGAVGYFVLDTTQFTNGVHTIGWIVYDNAGRGDGIGSRVFDISNGGNPAAAPDQQITGGAGVTLRQGKSQARAITPDTRGVHSVKLGQLGRLELELGAVQGNLMYGLERRALPLGSTLKGGVFYWQPPPGFLGDYQFTFVRPNGTQVLVKVSVESAFPSMLQ